VASLREGEGGSLTNTKVIYSEDTHFVERKRGTHHHQSSLSRILEVLSLNHIMPGERSASLFVTYISTLHAPPLLMTGFFSVRDKGAFTAESLIGITTILRPPPDASLCISLLCPPLSSRECVYGVCSHRHQSGNVIVMCHSEREREREKESWI